MPVHRFLLSSAILFAGLLACTSAHAAYDSADAPTDGPLNIIRITPTGEDVPAGKQIVIQFNRAVVPIGKMERDSADIPIIITPALPCEWRWINTSALSCNLPDDAPLQEATRYTLDIKPGIATEDGTTLADSYHHSFITQRPAIRFTSFTQWKSPGHPVLRVTFNQPVDKESVEEHVFMELDGGKQGRVSIEASPDPFDSTTPHIIPVPTENYALSFAQTAPRKSDDNLQQKDGKEARRVWLVEPINEMPLNTFVSLQSEPGIMSAFGSEKSAESYSMSTFTTFPEFAFLGVRCTSSVETNTTPIVFPPDSATTSAPNPTAKCDPMQPVELIFNSPVQSSDIGKMLKFTPTIGGLEVSEESEAEGEYDEFTLPYQLRQSHDVGSIYSVYLPYGLKAAQNYSVQSRASTMNIFERLWHWIQSLFINVAPIDLQDMFGREIVAPITLTFATDHRSPNYVLDYSDAVIEKNVDSEVPLYVNNLKDYTVDYRRVTSDTATPDLHFSRSVPDVLDVQFAVPLGVREMLEGKSGALFGTLSTEPLTRAGHSKLFAQVTPYQIHLKLGHFSSLAWVTDMATGKPVEGAKVVLYKDRYKELHVPKHADAEATTNALGIATLPGTNLLDPDLMITRGYSRDDEKYFLRVTKDDDMALMPVSYEFAVYAYHYDLYPSNETLYGHIHTWGTTAQGIYRAGDTIQYKIYVRNQDNKGFIPAPPKEYMLEVLDPMGKIVHEVKDITLSAFGGIHGEFTVPKESAVGWYQFQLRANLAGDTKEDASSSNAQNASATNTLRKIWTPMRVLVSDFTPAPFRVTNQLNGDLFHADQQIDVTTRAELHSGGAYTDAATRTTAILDSTYFISKHPVARPFQFDSYENEKPSQQIFQTVDKVNDKGEQSLSFSTGTPDVVYGKLTVESAVADDRGKYITARSRADYLGVNRLVGLQSPQWVYTVGKPMSIEYLVVNEQGAPISGTPVTLKVEREVRKSARVKGSGNAYLTQYQTSWESAGNCEGVSEDSPLACTTTPNKAGSYRIIASIQDSKGRNHSTTLDTYVTGSDYIVWDDENDSRLTIIPESTAYKVGDTARYLVKNPYPGAQALITIERYGVIDSFVQTFDDSTPIVEFPIKPDYLPGFYMSVVLVSPRVEKPLGEGQVDLGKPSFRMGYVNVPVQDPYKEMVITAKTDRDVYKPRDKVTVTLHAEPRVQDKKEPIELTVAVLDESVFDLIAGGKNYFDPYKGFYTLDYLDMRNYSLLTRLIGRQKFEKKGANPGGDGGADLSMRSLFKFVSYWNAELTTDKNGNATVSFEAPDNLTGWRVLAIATTPTDRFGLGEANFKVNRPTEVRPVMPNQVMEGDAFNAGFSVMNRTDEPRTLTVNIHAEGHIDSTKTPTELTQTITLDPYKRTTVFMPVQSSSIDPTRDTIEGALSFSVTAGDALDSDALTYTLAVHKSRSLDVAANYGTTTQDAIEESIQFPEGILPDIGSVSVVASPTVIGNVKGAFTYMRDYPYMCWEQKLSKGVMSAHYKNLKDYLPDDLLWKDSDTLPQTTLDQAAAFQTPSGGMAYFVAQDMYADPYLSAYTALAFNWLRKNGYAVPEQVETKLHTYLYNLLKNDAAPSFYSEGMTSTVRAVILAALSENGKIALSDLERYRPHLPKMSLFGKAHFLQSTLHVKGAEAYTSDAAQMIMATANETGGKFVFSEEWDDSYTRILASPLRENCAILDAFTAYGETDAGKNMIGDVPFKLVRTITQTRKNRDHWENTQENMFCMNALIDFARVYEKDKPAMTVKASMDNALIGETAFKDVRDPAVTLDRPITEGDAGRNTTLRIERNGTGRLYYATRLAYALPVEMSKPTNAGLEIHREYSVERNGKWELLQAPFDIKRGELVRVDLYVSVPAARHFVVVDDAVPGGLEPVNRDLATSSVVDDKKGTFEAAGGAFWFKFSDWSGFGVSRWSFYHQEIRHDSVRFYSDYLPAGRYHLSYAAQAIATGTFSALPAIAEEMYDPDVYGKTEAISLKVGEQPTP